MADLLRESPNPGIRRFYFTVRGENIFRAIRASSFTEAKALAAEVWLPYWGRIEWINHQEAPCLEVQPSSLVITRVKSAERTQA